MRRRVFFIVLGSSLLATVLVGACSDPPSVEGVGSDIPPPQPREIRERDSIFDADGVPLESETVVAGLRLPQGLDAMEGISSERRHQYSSSVPPAKLLRYFGPRLMTVQIEQDGPRVTYRAATPRDVRGGVVHLDVTIRPASAYASRVEIYERPPAAAPGTRIDPQTIREHLDRELDPSRRE